MSTKLLNDVSESELLQMREEGMSNYEIAKSLGVCYNTIFRIIGKQPKGMIKNRHAPVRRPVRTEEEIHAAVLLVKNREVSLVGEAASYTIDTAAQRVNIHGVDRGSFEIDLDQIGRLIEELQAIGRKSSTLNTGMEAW